MSTFKKQILGLIFVIPLLFGAGVQASTAAGTAEPGFPIPLCKENCLISTAISIKPIQYGRTTVLMGSILVVDETGAPVRQASVSVVWDLPDGSQQAQIVSTNRQGIAETSIVQLQSGDFTLRVEYLAKQGYTFDPFHGIVVKIFKG